MALSHLLRFDLMFKAKNQIKKETHFYFKYF